MKRNLTIALGVALLAATAWSAEVPKTVRTVSWMQLKDQGALPAGEVFGPGAGAEFEYVKLTVGAGDRPLRLATISSPGVDTPRFAMVGTIRYEGVSRAGYLEMLVHFADGQVAFSRLQTESAPAGTIVGESGWRPFDLPFWCGKDGPMPVKLELNLVLPGGGTTQLGPVRVMTYKDDPRIPDRMATGAWWSGAGGGWIGGIGGSVLGLLCALMAVLANRHVGAKLVMALLLAFMVVSLAALAAGVIGALGDQPYAVYFPLLLCGILYGLMGGLGLVVYPRIYQGFELRRMFAIDA